MAQTVSAPAPGARLLGAGTQAPRLSSTAAVGGAALVVIAFIASQTAGAMGIAFSPVGFSNIGQVLAPAVLMSLFIERATEVVISSWRSPQVQRLQHAMDAASDDDGRIYAQRALDFYRLETQRIAFVLSFSLAVIAALVGVRVVQPLLDSTVVSAMRGAKDQHAQWVWLTNLDILLTGLLMAGGADGIHRIVTTFTAFLDSIRDRAAAPAASAGAPASAPQPAAPVQQHPVAAAQPAMAQPVAAVPAVAAGGDFDDGV